MRVFAFGKGSSEQKNPLSKRSGCRSAGQRNDGRGASGGPPSRTIRNPAETAKRICARNGAPDIRHFDERPGRTKEFIISRSKNAKSDRGRSQRRNREKHQIPLQGWFGRTTPP